jgi:adenylylsulfate kinase
MTGQIIWLTGLSGSGKSTIAQGLYDILRFHHEIEILDGDDVRKNLSSELGFSKEDRDLNIRRIGYVANLLTKHGVHVIVAAISPYRAIRDELKNGLNMIEVYCDASIEECKRRDVKGIYAKVEAGEIKNFTGISDPYEEPLKPNVHLFTEVETVAESISKITKYFYTKKLGKV